jgi:iron complex outermembrane recepter protein
VGGFGVLIEQNLNMEVLLNYEHPRFRASVSVYRNQFWNYIYLNPTGTEFYGFQIYKYEQSDALLKGGELSFDWNPDQSKISLNTSLTLITATKSNDENLPFIPANKITGELQYHFSSGKIQNPVVRFGANYVLAQNNPAQFETTTSEYVLFNAGVSGSLRKLDLNLIATNLFNKTYYDHLSRFKYYRIYNMGRNIVLSINYKF